MILDLSQLATEIANQVINRLGVYEIKSNNSDELLTIDEASVFLKLKPTTLYKMVNRDEIPSIKINNGRLRFKKSEILTWLNNQTNKTRG